MSLIARVIDALERSAIPHALIGAGALAVHGVARSTADIDLLTTHPASLDEGTWHELGFENARVEIRRGDDSDPLLGVVRVSSPGERPVDVVVGRAPWQASILERSRPTRVGDSMLRVVTAPDLVLLKLFAGGPQDAWDIDQLLEHTPELIAEVAALVTTLPTDSVALWERIRRARGASA